MGYNRLAENLNVYGQIRLIAKHIISPAEDDNESDVYPVSPLLSTQFKMKLHQR